MSQEKIEQNTTKDKDTVIAPYWMQKAESQRKLRESEKNEFKMEIDRLTHIITEKDDAIDEWEEWYEAVLKKNEDLTAKVQERNTCIESLNQIIKERDELYESGRKKQEQTYFAYAQEINEENEKLKLIISSFFDRFPLPDYEWIYAKDAHDHLKGGR